VVLKSRDGLLDAGSSDSSPSMGIRIVWCTLALSLEHVKIIGRT
jgi:hypothetical protein